MEPTNIGQSLLEHCQLSNVAAYFLLALIDDGWFLPFGCLSVPLHIIKM